MALNRWLMVIGILIVLLSGSTAYAAGSREATTETDNQACLACHGEKGFSTAYQGEEKSLYVDVNQYSSSVHGTNDCITCHPSKQEIPHARAAEEVPWAEEANQQCKTCHREANVDYRAGIHGRLEAADKETARCSSCHGAHDIRKKEDPAARIHRNNVSATCMECHDGEIAESYNESFHGKAVYLGSQKAATCADCHTGHKILGPLDPQSTVSKENIPETCAQCHFFVRENYAKGTEHWTFQPAGPGAPMYWTLKFFTWLTIITITLLIVHIELELWRKYREAG